MGQRAGERAGRGGAVAGVPLVSGQGHYPGTFWSSTQRDHVIYESRPELAVLLLAGFDPSVRGIVAQPFLLRARVGGETRRHIPDYLLVTGTGPVVDVKPVPAEHFRFPGSSRWGSGRKGHREAAGLPGVPHCGQGACWLRDWEPRPVGTGPGRWRTPLGSRTSARIESGSMRNRAGFWGAGPRPGRFPGTGAGPGRGAGGPWAGFRARRGRCGIRTPDVGRWFMQGLGGI